MSKPGNEMIPAANTSSVEWQCAGCGSWATLPLYRSTRSFHQVLLAVPGDPQNGRKCACVVIVNTTAHVPLQVFRVYGLDMVIETM